MSFKSFLYVYRWKIVAENHNGLWIYFPWIGSSVYVPWPVSNKTADPNELIRPWLEENVGKQGLNWSWDVVYSESAGCDRLKVNFLNKNKAIMFKLIYG